MTNSPLQLIDTHNHFDYPIFDKDRTQLIIQAVNSGLHHMVTTGYVAKHFKRIIDTQTTINTFVSNQPTQNLAIKSHIALGLHPFFIKQHQLQDLQLLDNLLSQHTPIAIGEIGLDTFSTEMKQANNLAKQIHFFSTQLDLAVKHKRPVLLHIRKAHAESLKILKNHPYSAHELGGIAHSFSGGEQEAKAFVKLGFKLGVTGQICNPNAKKLRRAIIACVNTFGLECLVIETDCPDMTPLPCQTNITQKNRNIPSNLNLVLNGLSQLLQIDKHTLAKQLWHNSCQALQADWAYKPHI